MVETLLQLDGIATRLVLCPTDFALEHLTPVIAEAEIDAIVTDSTALAEQAQDRQSRWSSSRTRRAIRSIRHLIADRDRMGAVHLGHQRPAKIGRAYARQPHRPRR